MTSDKWQVTTRPHLSLVHRIVPLKQTLTVLCVLLWGLIPPGFPQAELSLAREIDRRTEEVIRKVVQWRRDFHQHPELSNREVRTSGIVAEHLKKLGLEVRTGVAHTGVGGVCSAAAGRVRWSRCLSPIHEEVLAGVFSYTNW